jgi:hypothetical protein
MLLHPLENTILTRRWRRRRRPRLPPPPPLSLKLEDHSLMAVGDRLFNILVFAADLHIGGGFSIRNLWTRHAIMIYDII